MLTRVLSRAATTHDTATVTFDGTVVHSTVDNAWWVANALLLNQSRLTEQVYWERTLIQMYRANPDLSPLTATRELAALQAEVGKIEKFSPTGSAMGDQLAAAFMGAVMEAVKKLPAGTGGIAAESAKVVYQQFSGLDPSAPGIDQVARAVDTSLHSVDLFGTARSIFSEAIDLAKRPGWSLYASAHNLAFATETAPVSATAAQMLANNPQLEMLDDLNQLLKSNGTIETSLSELRGLVEDTMGKIQESQRKAQATLDDLTQGQAVLLDYVHNEQVRQAKADEAARSAAAEQATLSVLNAGVSILSGLVSLFDPKAGKAVQLVGSAAIQIGLASVKFAAMAAAVGFGNALTSLAGAALTGNIIGAVMSLLPLFLDSGPSPEQMILDQISALREDVRKLGQRMEDRFDHVDEVLRTIYGQMMAQFDAIKLVLGRVQIDTADIKARLNILSNRLTHLEGGVWATVTDGFRRDLWHTVDSALGYQRRTGHPLPYDDYLAADSKFYTWATHDASDQAATGPHDRDWSMTNIAEELAKYPLDANISYLAQLPLTFGLPALSSGTLANPQDWYVAARAFTLLQLNNPTMAARNPALRSEIEEISAVGRRLEGVEKAVTSGDVDTATHPVTPLNPLFRELVTNYNRYADDVAQAVATARTNFLTGVNGLRPFAGTSQILSQPNPVTRSTCDLSRDLPAAVVDRLLHQEEFILGPAYGGKGKARFCVAADYTNVREGRLGKTEWMEGDVTATVSSQWVGAAADKSDLPPITLRSVTFARLGHERCSVLVTDPGDVGGCELPPADRVVGARTAGRRRSCR